jgi:hypothetical protein
MLAKFIGFLFPCDLDIRTCDTTSFAWQWRHAVGGDLVEFAGRSGSRSSARMRLPVVAERRGWWAIAPGNHGDGHWQSGARRHRAFWGSIELHMALAMVTAVTFVALGVW